MQSDLKQYLPQLVSIVRAAHQAILEVYQKSRQYTVQHKQDASPLTQADLMADAIITKGLSQLEPAWPVLSEEGKDRDFAERQHWQRYWLVDPLDGTSEFIRHSGDFTVNIALIENHQPILGIVSVPVLDEIYFAVRGEGAYQFLEDQAPRRLRARAWQPEETVVLASRSMKIERLREQFPKLGACQLDYTGSAVKFVRIAEGRADVYPRLGNTCEWDTAAGQCILEEAGGVVIDFNRQPLRYNMKPSLLNPHFIAAGDARCIQQLIEGE